MEVSYIIHHFAEWSPNCEPEKDNTPGNVLRGEEREGAGREKSFARDQSITAVGVVMFS